MRQKWVFNLKVRMKIRYFKLALLPRDTGLISAWLYLRNAEVGAKFDHSWSQVGITEYMALDYIMMSIQSAYLNGTSGLFICVQTCLLSPLPR